MITYALFVAACMVFAAVMDARQDAADICANRPIHHTALWMERAGFACVIISLCIAVAIYRGDPIGPLFIGLPLVAYGSFTPAFRFLLNVGRTPPKEPDYVSLSNVYDTVFIMVFGNNAGRAAYITELLALAVGVGIILKS